MTNINIHRLCSPYKILNLSDTASNLVSVEIQPTNMCNYNCMFCSYANHKNGLTIPSEQLDNICNQLIALGVKSVFFSGGGEPTLHPYIKEAIKKLKTAGIDIALITNGSRLDIISDVSNYCKYIIVNIPTTDTALYSAITGHLPAKWRYIPNTIDGSNSTILGARIVITAQNERNVLYSIEALLDNGYDYIHCTPAIDYTSGKQYQLRQETRDQILQFSSDKVMLADKGNSNCYSDIQKCWFLEQKLFACICADQEVYICPPLLVNGEKSNVGNCSERGIRELWNSDSHTSAIEYINTNYEIENCHNCRFRSYSQILQITDEQRNNPHKYFL